MLICLNHTIKITKMENNLGIYVKDVVSIIEWFIDNPKLNGLFNVGTGIPTLTI